VGQEKRERNKGYSAPGLLLPVMAGTTFPLLNRLAAHKAFQANAPHFSSAQRAFHDMVGGGTV